jgi:hypothetical protein
MNYPNCGMKVENMTSITENEEVSQKMAKMKKYFKFKGCYNTIHRSVVSHSQGRKSKDVETNGC